MMNFWAPKVIRRKFSLSITPQEFAQSPLQGKNPFPILRKHLHTDAYKICRQYGKSQINL